MVRLEKSLIRELSDGSTDRFPTFDDLAQWLVDKGEINSVEDLLGPDQDKLAAIFFQWIRRGQLSCLFAAKLAKDAIEAECPEDLCWHSRVAGPPLDSALVSEVQTFLTTEGREAEAVQLIFQDVTTPEDVVELVNVLCTHPSWSWKEVECEEESHFGVGLRWRLPESNLENWVLGFTPYEGTPFTRLVSGAPFSALAMRTLPRSSNSFFPIDEEGAVHLANMPLRIGCPVHVQKAKFDERTHDRREELLDGEMETLAKAKVTFALPFSVRSQLDQKGQKSLLKRIQKQTRKNLVKAMAGVDQWIKKRF